MKKNQAIIAVVVVVLVLLGGLVFLNARNKKASTQEATEDVLPVTDAIPTVDASVKVDLKASTGNKEVTLTVSNAPKGTSTIEYELSYIAKGNLPKGVIGTIDLADKSEVERKITLGTCSSGTCIYDQGVTSIKVSLKFNGDYGSKAYEKEFPLE